MQKKNNKETMKRVLKYIRKYTPALVLSLLLAGLTVLLTLYIPILTGNAIAHSTGLVKQNEMMKIGLTMGIIGLVLGCSSSA
jgi:ATP-binding cassette subfamily B protein